MAEAGLSDHSKLKNKFFIMRHGQAFSNTEGILISNPDIGTKQYGLTDLGKQQAHDAGEKLKSILATEENYSERVIVVASDFLRTRETAEIVHKQLEVKMPLKLEVKLRERWMGQLDMQKDYNSVKQLWALDEVDPTNTAFGHESLIDMLMRLSLLIQQLNKEYDNRIIILVSHGDPCQVIHSVFSGISPNEFRTKSTGFKNCDIRQLED